MASLSAGDFYLSRTLITYFNFPGILTFVGGKDTTRRQINCSSHVDESHSPITVLFFVQPSSLNFSDQSALAIEQVIMSSNRSIVSESESLVARRVSSPHKPKRAKSARKSSSLPAETVDYLKKWMMSPEHIAHPYPTEQEKAQIMVDTGIELKQLTNWFVNNRKRYWKPRVEARLQHQTQVTAPTGPVTNVVSPTKFNAKSSPTGVQYIALDMTQPTGAPVTPDRQSVHTMEDCRANVVSSAFVSFDRPRSPRAVSIGSSSLSSVSDESSLSNEMDDDFSNDMVDEVNAETQTVTRSETVDVHILRPTGDDPIPTIEDVTILTNVPSDRIIKSYDNRTLSYCFPLDGNDSKKVSRQTECIAWIAH